jgi:hypothetical protein
MYCHANSAVRRQGTVLIVIAGICSLLSMLALTFLTRMRSDAQESQLLLDETRARVMFASALQYISETSRIGWVNLETNKPEEAFGWIDIRNGLPGPRNHSGELLFTVGDKVTCTGKKWPAIGASMICNAQLWTRPPTAVTQNVAANPIEHNPNLEWKELVKFPQNDPAPIVGNFHDFIKGDNRPRPGTDAPCWFRVYRKAAAVFIVTCGGGTSRGYKNWAEVSPEEKRMWSSRGEWEMARADEPILWYEVAWSPAVAPTSPGYIYATNHNQLNITPATISKPFGGGGPEDQQNRRNLSGTFLYRQRLINAPNDDKW